MSKTSQREISKAKNRELANKKKIQQAFNEGSKLLFEANKAIQDIKDKEYNSLEEMELAHAEIPKIEAEYKEKMQQLLKSYKN